MVLGVCLSQCQQNCRCIHVKGQLFYIHSLFKINPSNYELQIKETGVSADQCSDTRDSLKIRKIDQLHSRL